MVQIGQREDRGKLPNDMFMEAGREWEAEDDSPYYGMPERVCFARWLLDHLAKAREMVAERPAPEVMDGIPQSPLGALNICTSCKVDMAGQIEKVNMVFRYGIQRAIRGVGTSLVPVKFHVLD